MWNLNGAQFNICTTINILIVNKISAEKIKILINSIKLKNNIQLEFQDNEYVLLRSIFTATFSARKVNTFLSDRTLNDMLKSTTFHQRNTANVRTRHL